MIDALVRARPLLAAALVLQSACYVYVPGTLEMVPEGGRIRALVTPDAEETLRVTFGMQSGRTLTGTLLARDGDHVSLFVPSVPIGTGLGSHPLYQQVDVARADILRVDVRRVDTFRTGVVVAIVAGVATAAVLKAVRGEESVVPGEPPPPPAESRRAWKVRIPLSWP